MERILGSPAIKLTDENGKSNAGNSQLYRILMIESAHLIWKLRCERVIRNNNEQHSPIEIKRRWINSINTRINLDQKMTNPKYEKKAIPGWLVQATWKGVLKDEKDIPDDWIKNAGVLVGIDSPTEDEGIG